MSAVGQAGQHAILYGERGVGKTSLAGLVHVIWSEAFKDSDRVVATRVACDRGDDFQSIWGKVAEGIEVEYEKRDMLARANGTFQRAAERLRRPDVNPHDIRRFFEIADKKFIVTIDEFDKVEDPDVSGLTADTIKLLSDYSVDTTLIVVGVADNVDDLIHEHQSIDRCLVQVLMPRMSIEELQQIVETRLDIVQMDIESRALLRIAAFSQGLPHYTHLLGLHAAVDAVKHGSRRVESANVDAALKVAIRNAQQSILDAYRQAVDSHQRRNLYQQTLVACAMTKPDELGYFTPADVREPMSQIMKERREIDSFMKQLRALTESARGYVLQIKGPTHNRKFRFRDPLLRPYVVFRAVDEGLVEESAAYAFSAPSVARQLKMNLGLEDAAPGS